MIQLLYPPGEAAAIDPNWTLNKCGRVTHDDVGESMALTKQSFLGSLAAAYVSPLILFWVDLAWRLRAGVDASMCGAAGSTICTAAEKVGAFLLSFLWALIGLPFALVITLPCALILGRMTQTLERRFDRSTLASLQYGLAAAVGVTAGLILDIAFFNTLSLTAIAGLVGGLCGAWVFRRQRYFLGQSGAQS